MLSSNEVNRTIHNLIATALFDERVPAKLLHLFGGVSVQDCGIVCQMEKLATIKGDILGSVVLNSCNVPAFKAARTVFNVIAIDLVNRILRIVKYVKMYRKGHNDSGYFHREFKLARLVLSIDRRHNWLSQMTVERLCAAVNGLNTYCSEASLQRSHTSELLNDFRSHVSNRPRRKIHKAHEQQRSTHVRTHAGLKGLQAGIHR